MKRMRAHSPRQVILQGGPVVDRERIVGYDSDIRRRVLGAQDFCRGYSGDAITDYQVGRSFLHWFLSASFIYDPFVVIEPSALTEIATGVSGVCAGPCTTAAFLAGSKTAP